MELINLVCFVKWISELITVNDFMDNLLRKLNQLSYVCAIFGSPSGATFLKGSNSAISHLPSGRLQFKQEEKPCQLEMQPHCDRSYRNVKRSCAACCLSAPSPQQDSS